MTGKTVEITNEDITQRAYEISQSDERGTDEENWHLAEQQRRDEQKNGSSPHEQPQTGAVAIVEQAETVQSRNGATTHPGGQRPRLLYFYSPTSGLSRRVDGYLAQVLQRHRNHETFQLIRVAVEQHKELAANFEIRELPTLVVIDGSEPKVRVEAPRDRKTIEAALSPWLR